MLTSEWLSITCIGGLPAIMHREPLEAMNNPITCRQADESVRRMTVACAARRRVA
jgi:hypothetical protein